MTTKSEYSTAIQQANKLASSGLSVLRQVVLEKTAQTRQTQSVSGQATETPSTRPARR